MIAHQPSESAPVNLDSRDYQRLFAILETAAGSVDTDFFHNLQDALASHLGWTDSVIVNIPATVAPFPSRPTASNHIIAHRRAGFVEEYLDHWLLRNPFKTAGAALLLGKKPAVTLADLRPHSSETEWDFVDLYLHRHRIADVLYGRIDAGPEGSALICRYVPDESDIDGREVALMTLLARHLSPWLRSSFARSPETVDGAVLTHREAQVADLVARGMSNREIAGKLQIRTDTVKKYVMMAMKKTGADNRTQLALRYLGR